MAELYFPVCYQHQQISQDNIFKLNTICVDEQCHNKLQLMCNRCEFEQHMNHRKELIPYTLRDIQQILQDFINQQQIKEKHLVDQLQILQDDIVFLHNFFGKLIQQIKESIQYLHVKKQFYTKISDRARFILDQLIKDIHFATNQDCNSMRNKFEEIKSVICIRDQKIQIDSNKFSEEFQIEKKSEYFIYNMGSTLEKMKKFIEQLSQITPINDQRQQEVDQIKQIQQQQFLRQYENDKVPEIYKQPRFPMTYNVPYMVMPPQFPPVDRKLVDIRNPQQEITSIILEKKDQGKQIIEIDSDQEAELNKQKRLLGNEVQGRQISQLQQQNKLKGNEIKVDQLINIQQNQKQQEKSSQRPSEKQINQVEQTAVSIDDVPQLKQNKEVTNIQENSQLKKRKKKRSKLEIMQQQKQQEQQKIKTDGNSEPSNQQEGMKDRLRKNRAIYQNHYITTTEYSRQQIYFQSKRYIKEKQKQQKKMLKLKKQQQKAQMKLNKKLEKKNLQQQEKDTIIKIKLHPPKENEDTNDYFEIVDEILDYDNLVQMNELYDISGEIAVKRQTFQQSDNENDDNDGEEYEQDLEPFIIQNQELCSHQEQQIKEEKPLQQDNIQQQLIKEDFQQIQHQILQKEDQ